MGPHVHGGVVMTMQTVPGVRPSVDSARQFLPDSSSGDWIVLHTKSRQEKALAEALRMLSIAHYLPLTRQVRYYGRHKVVVELPVFPSYLFVRGAINDAYRADRTRRVAKIINVADQTTLDWELRNLHLALTRDAPLDLSAKLTRGTLVEVRAGPFKGLQGVVEDRARPTRLVLQVAMLGRAVSLEVDDSLLERLN